MILVLLLTLVALLLLFYTYIGYPALMVLLAQIRPRPIRRASIEPSVSLVIAAHNERDTIAEKIENSLKLEYPREKLQIIVADDGSTDGTPDIVRSFNSSGVILSAAARGGKVTAMNRGAKLAVGEIVVFSDANVICAPNSVSELVANFADDSIGCVVARKRVITTESKLSQSDGLYWKYETLIQTSESRLHSTMGVSGHMQAIRRHLLPEFPENTILDDQYLALTVLNQGYRVIVEPKAICWEGSSAAMQGERARRRRITAGRFHLIKMLGQQFPNLSALHRFQLFSHKVLRLFIPVYMLVAYLGNLLLAFGPHWAGQDIPVLHGALVTLLVVQTAFYLAALAGYIGERIGRRSKLLYLPYFLCSTNMASLEGLLSFLSKGTGGAWQRVQRE